MIVISLEFRVLLRAHLLERAIPEVSAMGKYVPLVDKRDRLISILRVLCVPLLLQFERIF